MKEHYDNNWLKRIADFVRNGKIDAALTEIDKYRDAYPKDVMINLTLVRLYIAQDKDMEALELCFELLDKKFHKKEDVMQVEMCIGDIYAKRKDYDNALEMYRRAFERASDRNISAILKIINLYDTMGDYNTCLGLLDLYQNESNESIFNYKRSNVLSALGNHKKSLEIMKKVKIDRTNGITEQERNYRIGYEYYMLADFEKAEEYLRKALTNKNQLYWNAYCFLARIEMKRNYLVNAINMLNQVVKADGSDESRFALIDAYMRRCDYENAYKVAHTFKSFENREYAYGRLAYDKSNYSRAKEHFDKAMSADSDKDNYNLITYAILVNYRLKKYFKARKLLRKYYNGNESKYNPYSIQDLNLLRIVMNYRDGRFINVEGLTYSQKQAISYDEEEAIKHVQNNHVENSRISCFNDTVSVRELFIWLHSVLPTLTKYSDGFLDRYILEYKNIGETKGNSQDKICVLCLPETFNIVTCYPYENEEENYGVKRSKFIQRESQIDKFNRRYGLVRKKEE